MENSHQEEEDFEKLFDEDDTQESTPAEGDDSEKVSDEEFLKRWNEITGRKDKEVDAIRKHEAEVRKAFAEKGRQKSEQKVEVVAPISTIHPVMKSLYFKEHPEAEGYWETVEQEARNLNKDPFELYENSSFFKGEAKARYEARIRDEEAKQKISKPSNGTGSSKADLSSIDSGEVGKLSPSDKLAWLKMQVDRERNGAG